MTSRYFKKGSAIIMALIIVSIAAILFLGIIGYITSQIKYASHAEAKEKALHIADAGLNYYKWYLAHAVEGMNMQEIAQFWENTNPHPKGINGAYESDYEGIGKYTIKVKEPDPGSAVVTVTITGQTHKKPDVKRTLQVRLRPRSWSEYAILANSNIQIAAGEEIDGLVHSNGGIRFDGVCNNEVTSSVESYYYGGISKPGVWTSWSSEYNSTQGSEVFLGGKIFPVPVKDFDSVLTSFNLIFNKAKELNFDYSPATKAHQIILKGDVIDVKRVVNEKNGKVTGTQDVAINAPLPDVAAIYVDKNIWIEGTLGAGKKLVVAANNPSVSHGNIYISDDIKYQNYTSGTVLGLVAKNNIDIVEDSKHNLRIDAAMLAQVGRVGRDDYGNNKGNLTIYGAIATNQGYGFQGYQNVSIGFDSNLLLNPPPFFPIEGVYRTDFWNEIKNPPEL